jgi:hypothetical protein
MILNINNNVDIALIFLFVVLFSVNVIMFVALCTECTRSSMIFYNKYKLNDLSNRVSALEGYIQTRTSP